MLVSPLFIGAALLRCVLDLYDVVCIIVFLFTSRPNESGDASSLHFPPIREEPLLVHNVMESDDDDSFQSGGVDLERRSASDTHTNALSPPSPNPQRSIMNADEDDYYVDEMFWDVYGNALLAFSPKENDNRATPLHGHLNGDARPRSPILPALPPLSLFDTVDPAVGGYHMSIFVNALCFPFFLDVS